MLVKMPKKSDKADNETKKREARTHRWNPDILQAIENFQNAQDVPPSDIAVIEKAAIEFLEKRGFWPLPKEKKPKAE